jgi:oxygen-dependent protoporphyrinogen oxidase
MPDSLFSFLATPLFSAPAKLRLMLEPFVSRRDASREESIAEFAQRRLGREFLHHAIDALVGGIYAGDPRKLSVSQAFPKLHALEQEYGSLIKGQIFGHRRRQRSGEKSKAHAKKLSFDEGLQVLPDAICASLKERIRLNSPVTALTQKGNAWRVNFRANGNAMQTEHSAVVYAGTAFALSKIEIQARRPLDVSTFDEIEYPPVASVVLGFRREDVAHPLDGFGVLIPRCEGFQILGSIFSSSLFPGRAPDGHVCLTSYIGGARSPELAQQSPDQLFALTVRDLRELLGIRGEPTFRHHVLFVRAIPQYNLGYQAFRDRMSEIEGSAPGLFLAGHYRDGISVSDCIVSGENVAARITEHLAAARSEELVREAA